ncbi:MAG: bifunctional glutamate N-acetyltransferase/amino-acid acetyltransferase ArgJ [Actinomycetota bacterium]|nr:bifunctional glutamate N-acetyltransferase/amino-acid acetyltransferase ArgJ [Actinomycetota bacterium]
MASFPDGFGCFVANLGIKDDSDDLVVIAADDGCSTAGVFTKSRFAGPSVQLSRERVADGRARAIVVVSKNANVATGNDGRRDAVEVTSLVAEQLGCAVDEVLIASTGVIGRRYPMERIRNGLRALPAVASGASVEQAARAMMTTDTVAKVAESAVESSTARVVGIAKGVGMIEPDMATMIAVILTDAEVPAYELDATFRRVVERTFNCVSIDTDTSTSDTAIVMASGAAGPVRPDALERALESVATALARKIAADGEGATTLIEVVVDAARDWAQAKRVAKSIVNSPLVKTAVHGADPNWGRVAMAVGKCSDDTDIDPDRVVIRFGTDEVYPRLPGDDQLTALSRYLERNEVLIHVSLSTGDAFARVWGCDLTDGYIRINADYTS